MELKECVEGITSEPGDICLVAPGTYELSALAGPTLVVSVEGLTIRSEQGPDVTILRGAGTVVLRVVASGVVIDGFTLSNSGSSPLIRVQGGDGVRAEGVQIINNIFTDELGAYADGVLFSSFMELREVTITNNVFRGGRGSAIHLRDIAELREVEITDSIIRSMGSAGILVEAIGRLKGFTVAGTGSSHCEISSVGGDGIRLSGVRRSADVSLFNCIVEGSATGLNIVGGGSLEGLNLLSNEVRRNKGRGVAVSGAELSRVWITDNVIRDNGGEGLSFFASGKAEGLNLARNLLARNGGFGLALTGGGDLRGLSLAANRIWGNGSGGIICTAGQDLKGVTVVENEIRENRGNGLLLQAGGDLRAITITDDEIGANRRHGLRMVGGEEVEGVSLLGNEFSTNRGTGLYLQGREFSQVEVESNTASENGDHGIMIEAERSLKGLRFRDNRALRNDLNGDTVGAGFYIDAGGELADAIIQRNIADGNHSGVRLEVKAAGGQISKVILDGNRAWGNRAWGIRIESPGELYELSIEGNSLLGNGINLALHAERGSGISVRRNELKGAIEVGLLLDAVGAAIAENEIGRNRIGVLARRAAPNRINRNNIVDNEQYGIDARGLPPKETIDAERNWWGHPSGPGGVGPGLGDAVTEGVDFEPWLTGPVAVEGANFQITALEVTPSAPEPLESVTIIATVENTGIAEGTREIIIRLKSDVMVLHEERRPTTLLPAGSATIALSYTFTAAGSYTIEVITHDDARSQVIRVGEPLLPAPEALSIEEVVAALMPGDPSGVPNPNLVIGDQEILQAIHYWITGDPVPETGGQVIADVKMHKLIQLWITGAQVTAAAGGTADLALESEDEGKSEGAALAVEGIAFTGSHLIVRGVGIAGVAVRVYDLTGQLVFGGAGPGNALEFHLAMPNGAPLANGVYLYTVTVISQDGRCWQSGVRKLAILR